MAVFKVLVVKIFSINRFASAPILKVNITAQTSYAPDHLMDVSVLIVHGLPGPHARSLFPSAQAPKVLGS